LWLEEHTGMLLRFALIDHDGQQLQQLSFTSLELGGNISDAELEPGLDGDAFTTQIVNKTSSAASTSISSIPVSPRVPRGFRLVNAGRGLGPDGKQFEHLLYSDGLSSFSIYVERAAGETVTGQVDTMGAVHAYTTRADGQL